MFSTVLPFLLAIGGITAQCLTGNDSPAMMNPESKMSLIESRFNFALDSLKKAEQIETENIFFSPHSLYQAVSLAYFGARGTTEANLKRALRIPDDLSKVDVQRYYAFENSLDEMHNNQTNVSDNYEYRVANRLWVSDDRKLRECMLDFFGEQLEKANFRANPDEMRIRINDWVSNMTKGHIRDLLTPGSIDSETDLVLANAVYFKGLWQYRFDPNNSKRDIFYEKASGSQLSIVTFMRQKGNFNFVVSEVLGAYVLELPYKGNEISMFVLLPPSVIVQSQNPGIEPRNSIHQFMERLATQRGSQELRELLDDGMPLREVEVSLPRFELERDLQVGQLLTALGAGELMVPNVADLRGFVADGERGLHLGDAVHRAKIEVTEEGTTAAAATALFSFRSSRPTEPAVFNANHPFVYLIYDKKSHTILFSGVFRSPPGAQPATV
ncbi:PREDICTED: serpin B3-like [Dinoponera quadriceps]|uniref:Serpin B3-like n=1 Tax=Dinoponera quadriceps TaxID=609295 RepID=A0A6P3XBW9_DINQU|nr:PREDICTED: serpin B3-like [Dinoponera quadriceps]